MIIPQTRPDRAVIRLAGEAVLGFLNNLLTVNVFAATPVYGALLSPQGKILHDVFVVPDGDVVWIDVAKEQAAALLQRLILYRLRGKFEIAHAPHKEVAVSAAADLMGISYVDPRHAAMGRRAIVDVATLPGGDAAYDKARLALGLADSAEDIGTGQLFVHEANLDQLNGVVFNKGCYVGQEVVARSHHRSSARNRIVPVRFTGPATKGSAIVSGDTRVGDMLSSYNGQGLALLRLDRLAEVKVPLLAQAVRLHVQKPAWMNIEMTVPEVAA